MALNEHLRPMRRRKRLRNIYIDMQAVRSFVYMAPTRQHFILRLYRYANACTLLEELCPRNIILLFYFESCSFLRTTRHFFYQDGSVIP